MKPYVKPIPKLCKECLEIGRAVALPCPKHTIITKEVKPYEPTETDGKTKATGED